MCQILFISLLKCLFHLNLTSIYILLQVRSISHYPHTYTGASYKDKVKINFVYNLRRIQKCQVGLPKQIIQFYFQITYFLTFDLL